MITAIPSSADTVLLSVNPKAGRSSPLLRAQVLCSSLRELGLNAEIMTDLDRVSERANDLFSRSKLRALVGVGGDGTASELVNRTLPGVPVTLLSSGTANLLAKHFHLPGDPRKMARLVANGSWGTFDAGRANGRLFLIVLSAGIDADIVQKVHRAREESFRQAKKKGAHISYFSYLGPVFSSIRRYKYPEIDVRIESNSLSSSEEESEKSFLKGGWFFTFNFPRYGWGVPLVYDSWGADSRFDYCLFKGRNIASSLWSVFWAQLGTLHRFLPGTRLGKGAVIELSSSESVPYELDGDPGGLLPVRIEIVSKRFTVLASERRIRKLSRVNLEGKDDAE